TSSWIGKLSGSYVFPKGILGGVSYSIRSGDRLARQVLLQGGKEVASAVVNAGLPGSLKLENIPVLDLRATKRFTLRKGQTFEVRLAWFDPVHGCRVPSSRVGAGSTDGEAPVPACGDQEGRGFSSSGRSQLGWSFRL